MMVWFLAQANFSTAKAASKNLKMVKNDSKITISF
jgi:hypothetical protein